MRLEISTGKRPELGVFRMAAALAFAAFLGGALGLVWQSSGFGDDDPEQEQTSDTAPDAADAPTPPVSG